MAQTLLRANYDPNFEYDVIVIGSGMGGGVVASALADEKKNVLVLEAGSLLFPTHVGNLPRRIEIGKFQKHIWSLYYNFNVKNYNAPNGVYNGAQAFNLGGRSLFWGSSIPPLAKWELEAWPESIQKYLLDESEQGGYPLARGVFNSTVPKLNDFHAASVANLTEALGAGWEVLPAPVAVEYAGPTEWSVPAGIFSTADLLLEDAMSVGSGTNPDWREPLTVNLNQAVWDVLFDPKNNKRATGVRCWDTLQNIERTYRAKSVVISAGTLESTKIALTSKITNDKIGQGIVDHAILYRHFVIAAGDLNALNIPSTQPPRNEPQSTKLLLRHQAATLQDWGFDIILELGAQFNQGRFVDPDHERWDVTARDGKLLCELVFQFYSPLMEGNRVSLGGAGHADPVTVNMERAGISDHLLAQARGIRDQIFTLFKAQPVPGEDNWPELQVADVGGVAHEVGTLRMPVRNPDGTLAKGVLDEDLKFEGYENLYACDNSVFPCSPAGNPSLTLVALARRLATTLAGKL